MKQIKFRQPIFSLNDKFIGWHYWGDISPKKWADAYTYSSARESRRNSQLFTGYHDKTGQEIYEGDIVRLNKGAAIIKFEEGRLCFNGNQDWLDTWNWADDASRFKIAANIIENPNYEYETN